MNEKKKSLVWVYFFIKGLPALLEFSSFWSLLLGVCTSLVACCHHHQQLHFHTVHHRHHQLDIDLSFLYWSNPPSTRMQKRLLRQSLTVAQRFRVGTYAVVDPSKFIQNNKIYVSTNTVSVGIRCFSSINSNNGNTNVTPVAVFTKGSKDIKKSKLSLYADLTKFRLSSLVVVTSGAGFLCGGAPVDWTMMAATCVGTGLCAASAGSFNQIIERHQDAAMNRTKQRPLPSGQLSVSEASAVGDNNYLPPSLTSPLSLLPSPLYLSAIIPTLVYPSSSNLMLLSHPESSDITSGAISDPYPTYYYPSLSHCRCDCRRGWYRPLVWVDQPCGSGSRSLQCLLICR